VAVSLGPGSFNGLRVGVSTGKGLALSLGLPIYGLSSLDMVAAQHRYINGTLCAVIEAGRGRLGIGFYRIKNGAWKRQGDYQNLTVEELAAQITAPTTIAGELNPAQLTFLEEKPGKHVLVLPPAIAFRRAGLLAEFAYSRMKAGDKGDDLANLQPIYLHQPVKTPGES
jgi:tRNA threonylcarbamoyladenosine biosynthesis protein TsaB